MTLVILDTLIVFTYLLTYSLYCTSTIVITIYGALPFTDLLWSRVTISDKQTHVLVYVISFAKCIKRTACDEKLVFRDC